MMRHRMRNPHGLQVRRYVARFIELDEYLTALPGEKISELFCVMELNEFMLNSIINSWMNHAYVQGFDC